MLRYDTETLASIFQKDRNSKLVLPNFQRDFVWNREKQTKLLASVLVGLPIGSVLIVEGKHDDFPSRNLCFTEPCETDGDCWFLLDGQQRLSCLKSIFYDFYSDDKGKSWQETWTQLYGPLRNRWFIQVIPPEDSDADIWGWENLRFQKQDLESYEPSDLEPFIKCHRILIRESDSSDAFHHPAYKVKNPLTNEEITSPAQRRAYLTEKLAEKGLVPLFEICTDLTSNSLHNLTLRRIAGKRREILKAKVQDGEISIEDVLGSDVNLDNSDATELWQEHGLKWAAEVREALEKLVEQSVMETILPSDEIGRAASVFETINEGGTKLSNFDLIVAKTAKPGSSEKSLTQILKEYIQEPIQIPASIYDLTDLWRFDTMQAMQDSSIARHITEAFLNLVSILSYSDELPKGIYGIRVDHIKQNKILRLKPDQILNNFKVAIKSLRKASAFLQYRCGIVYLTDISYKLMILPVAYLFAIEEQLTARESWIREIWESKECINRLEYWYWLSLFSGRYREKQNERCIQDIKSLHDWIVKGSDNPFANSFDSIFENSEYSDEPTLLYDNVARDIYPPVAIRNGILQYVLSREPRDFRLISGNGQSTARLRASILAANADKLEEHHIIPLGSVTNIGEGSSRIRGERQHLLNCPLNLTYISKEANRAISSLSPSQYLARLSDAAVTGHVISSNFIHQLKEAPELYNEDFYKQVLKDRFQSIKQQVKSELEHLLD